MSGLHLTTVDPELDLVLESLIDMPVGAVWAALGEAGED